MISSLSPTPDTTSILSEVPIHTVADFKYLQNSRHWDPEDKAIYKSASVGELPREGIVIFRQRLGSDGYWEPASKKSYKSALKIRSYTEDYTYKVAEFMPKIKNP